MAVGGGRTQDVRLRAGAHSTSPCASSAPASGWCSNTPVASYHKARGGTSAFKSLLGHTQPDEHKTRWRTMPLKTGQAVNGVLPSDKPGNYFSASGSRLSRHGVLRTP